MKQLLVLSSLILTSFALPARAQSADVQSPAVRLEQLAVGIRLPSPTNRDGVVGLLEPASTTAIVGESVRSDSAGRPAAQDIVIGAMIGGAVGIVAAVIASRQKQSLETDPGTTGWMLICVIPGMILGAIIGAVAHFGG